MGIFRQFPYSNFHEMNLDWLLSKMKELSEEWFSYHENWEKWVNDTDAAFKELKDYVMNYFDNLDVKTEIVRQFDILKEQGFFDDIIEQLALKKENINCMLVGSGFVNYSQRAGALNGGCYIGNNHIALYYAYDTSDVGVLEIVDATTFEVLSETTLRLRHGNSLTYNPITNKLYSCACFSASDTSVLIPDIDVVDVADIYNPSIIETITPPLPSYATGVYSLAYDIITDKYYAICARGTTSGEYNRLIHYNNDLSQIIDETVLAGTVSASSQGVQSVYNDIAYLLYYTPTFRSVYTFDVTTGELLNVYSLPTLINGYRYIGEVQNVFYNTDTQDWFVGSRYAGSGVSGHIAHNIIQCGFYKSLPNVTISNNSVNDTGHLINITVEQGASFIPDNITRFPCIMDAVHACKTAGVVGNISFTGDNRVIGQCDIYDFTGSIVGSNTNHVTVAAPINIYNSDIRFTYVDFNATNGSHTYVAGSGSLCVYNSNLAMTGCATAAPVLIADSIMLGLQTQNNFVSAVRTFIIGNTAALPVGNTMVASAYQQYTPTPA